MTWSTTCRICPILLLLSAILMVYIELVTPVPNAQQPESLKQVNHESPPLPPTGSPPQLDEPTPNAGPFKKFRSKSRDIRNTKVVAGVEAKSYVVAELDEFEPYMDGAPHPILSAHNDPDPEEELDETDNGALVEDTEELPSELLKQSSVTSTSSSFDKTELPIENTSMLSDSLPNQISAPSNPQTVPQSLETESSTPLTVSSRQSRLTTQPSISPDSLPASNQSQDITTSPSNLSLVNSTFVPTPPLEDISSNLTTLEFTKPSTENLSSTEQPKQTNTTSNIVARPDAANSSLNEVLQTQDDTFSSSTDNLTIEDNPVSGPDNQPDPFYLTSTSRTEELDPNPADNSDVQPNQPNLTSTADKGRDVSLAVNPDVQLDQTNLTSTGDAEALEVSSTSSLNIQSDLGDLTSTTANEESSANSANTSDIQPDQASLTSSTNDQPSVSIPSPSASNEPSESSSTSNSGNPLDDANILTTPVQQQDTINTTPGPFIQQEEFDSASIFSNLQEYFDLNLSLVETMIYTVVCILFVGVYLVFKLIKVVIGEGQRKFPKVEQPKQDTSYDISVESRELVDEMKAQFDLQEEVKRLERCNRFLKQKTKLAPLRSKLRRLRADFNYASYTYHGNKFLSLFDTYNSCKAKNCDYQDKIELLKYEYLLLLRSFVQLIDLIDVVKDIEFNAQIRKLKQATFDIDVETQFLNEQMTLFHDLATKFRSEYSQLSKEVEDEKSKASVLDKHFSRLKNEYQEANLDVTIEDLVRSIDAKVAEADRYYRDYIANYYFNTRHTCSPSEKDVGN